jgi:hypothetical protein
MKSGFFHATDDEGVSGLYRVEDVVRVVESRMSNGEPGVRISFGCHTPLLTKSYDLVGFIANVLEDKELQGDVTTPD